MSCDCPSPPGTLLHFEDHGLKNVYFLDPQWLAKLMANVIHPAAGDEGSPIKNGAWGGEDIYVCEYLSIM